MLSPPPTLVLALLLALSVASPGLAESSRVIELEPQPLTRPDPTLGSWESAPDGTLGAGDHALRPLVRLDEGLGLLARVPGGLIDMQPISLVVGSRALPAGAAKLSGLQGGRLEVTETWQGVDEELDLRPGEIKHDLLVSRAALEGSVGGELRASWRLGLPEGAKAGLEPGSGLVLRSADGSFIARVPPPLVSDAADSHGGRHAHFDWDGIVLTVVVDADWLWDPARDFPLRIDPSITLFPSSNTRTGWVDEFSNRGNGAIDSGSLADVGFGFDVRGYAEFDSTDIPDSATILDVRLRVWLSNHDNPDDPAVPLRIEIKAVDSRASTPAAALHAAIPPLFSGTVYATEDLPGTGASFCPNAFVERDYVLGPLAEADLEAKLPLNWFTLGFVSQIVTDPSFDHVDYIGFPPSVNNSDCLPPQIAVERIRLVVEYIDDQPPDCDAGGPYLTACAEEGLLLDGSASSDPEGASLTYLWTSDCPGVIEDSDQVIARLALDEPCNAACTVTLEVDDGTSSRSCQADVLLADAEAPAVQDMPPDEAVPCDEIPPIVRPVASDDCDPMPELHFLGESRSDEDCLDRYTLFRIWQAEDRCGLLSPIERQVIVVSDDSPPVLEGLPEDLVVACDDIPPVALPTASDDCDPLPQTFFLGSLRDDGPCPDSYTVRRRWQAQDRCGNASEIAEQTIEVIDDTAPAWDDVPPSLAVSCSDVPPVPVLTASDDCDPDPVVEYLGETRVDGPCPDSYTLHRSWRAIDRCGNVSALAEQELAVSDSQAPTLAGVPPDESVSCAAIPPLDAPTASDDCDPAPVVEYLGEEREDGPCPDSYTLVRRWQALDRCGNSSPIAEQEIVVSDSDPPSLSGVPSDASVSCDAVPGVGAPSASDDCDPAPMVEYLGETRVDGPCPDSYTLVRRWRALDRCGNASPIVEQEIAVSDSEPPSLAGVPVDVEVSCDAVPDVGAPTASDDCDPAPMVEYLGELRVDGPCSDSYTLVRSWRALDRCGNVSPIAEQEILVSDTQPPSLAGVPADASASCDAVPGVGAPTASDDCDPAPTVEYLGEEREDGPCPDSYTLRRRWQALDRCGNASAIAEQVITVFDDEAPTLVGVPADGDVDCDAVPPPPVVTATDACDPMPLLVLSELRVDGACEGEYSLTRTWTATDRCGNATAQSQVLNVVDTNPPVIVAPPAGDLACLWPPNHRYVCFDLDSFDVEVSDACSEPVSLSFVGCESNQPDDAGGRVRDEGYNGDGHTIDDCLVLDGGRRVCVRSERAGSGPDAQEGRRYALTVVAVDACGNASEPALLGSIHVPHDQSPAADCIDASRVGVKDKDLLP